GSTIAGVRLGLPRDLGRPLADQGFHADQERKIAPPHRRPRRADRGRLKSGPYFGRPCGPLPIVRPHLDRAPGHCNNLSLPTTVSTYWPAFRPTPCPAKARHY